MLAQGGHSTKERPEIQQAEAGSRNGSGPTEMKKDVLCDVGAGGAPAAEEIARPQELGKEQKRALLNFRDQVQYKDYKGLLKTLKALEGVANFGEGNYVIPVKYMRKYSMLRENLLLLKNIIISNMKYSITNKKSVPSHVVEIIGVLSEKYNCNVKNTIIVWISNTYMAQYGGCIRGTLKGLSDTGKVLGLLLELRDKCKLQYSYLPIWWNISNAVAMDLSVLVKNRLIEIIAAGKFGEKEYLQSLAEVMDFERRHPVSGRSHAQSSEHGIFSRRPEASETVIDVLEDISNEASILSIKNGPDRLERNILSSSYLASIEIFISHELRGLEQTELVFVSAGEDKDRNPRMDIYSVFNVVATTLSKLLYFRNNNVFRTFLEIADALLAQLIAKRTRCDQHMRSVLSVLELVFYTRETADQLARKVKILAQGGTAECTKTLKSLEALEELCYEMAKDNVGLHVKKQRLFRGLRKKRSEYVLEKESEELLKKISGDAALIAEVISQKRREVLRRYMSVLGEVLFYKLLEARMSRTKAETLLAEMSRIEYEVARLEASLADAPGTHSSAQDSGREGGRCTMMETIKTYAKIFLVDPGNSEQFFANFQGISSGVFIFQQIIERLEDRRYNKDLMELQNRAR